MTHEATQNGSKIELNGWFRITLIGFATLCLSAFTWLGTSMGNTKENTSKEFTKVRQEMNDKNEGLRREVKEDLTAIREEIQKLHITQSAKFERVITEIEGLKKDN